jgi:aminopeptidase N
VRGLALLLLIALATPGCRSAERRHDARWSPPDFRVVAYQLELRIDRDQRTVTGRETLRIRGAGAGLSVVSFPRNGLEILAVSGAALPVPTQADQLPLRLPAPLAAGEEVSLTIDYRVPGAEGRRLPRRRRLHQLPHLSLDGLPRSPRRQGTFTLAMAVPAGLTLIASGERKEGTPGREVWHEAVPSSPYLFGFALGNFARIARTHAGVTLEWYVRPGDEGWAGRVLADDDRMLDFFVARAGAAPAAAFLSPGRRRRRGGAGAELVLDPGARPAGAAADRPHRGRLVAHELAHQFWGNLITCADWSHFWLNEGLTVFMVAAYKEERWGRLPMSASWSSCARATRRRSTRASTCP